MPSRCSADRRCITDPRAVASIRTTRLGALTATTSQTECLFEIDNHADTCVVGSKTALFIHDYDIPVQVHGYDEGVGEIEACRMVSAVITYDHPKSGDTYILGTSLGHTHTPNGKQPIIPPTDECQRRPCE